MATHISTTHKCHLQSWWPPALTLTNLVILDSADIAAAAHLDPEHEHNQVEAMDVLQDTFQNQKLTIHVHDNPVYQRGAIAALTLVMPLERVGLKVMTGSFESILNTDASEHS